MLNLFDAKYLRDAVCLFSVLLQRCCPKEIKGCYDLTPIKLKQQSCTLITEFRNNCMVLQVSHGLAAVVVGV